MAEWIYGRRAVTEILKSDIRIRKILIAGSPDDPSLREIRQSAELKRVQLESASRKNLDAIVQGNHQGVAAYMDSIAPQPFKEFLSKLAAGSLTFVSLLDEIQDPQNLGAILRNAVCFGCSGVILPKWRSAGLTAAVMKSSSGALAHCPVAEIANLSVAVERLKEKGFFVYGADSSPESSALENVQIRYPAALILGNEHRGIRPTLKKVCDEIVRISQKSEIQSLNVASASAIFFHALSRKAA